MVVLTFRLVTDSVRLLVVINVWRTEIPVEVRDWLRSGSKCRNCVSVSVMMESCLHP